MIDTSETEVEILQESNTETEDIMRCLKTLYGSKAGELATDRDFGIDPSCLDMPIPASIPLLVAEITEKTARYEPRVQVVRVEMDADESHSGKIKPKVVVELV